MSNTANTKSFPYQIARASWIAGVIAIGLVAFTAQNSARVTGELIAFIFIGVGILASIVSLAAIPKLGSKNILWPALAGIAINGLLLAIAIPNFLHARQRVVEQGVQREKQTANWKQYQIGGLEFVSPIELTNIDTIVAFQRGQKYLQLSAEQKTFAEESAKRTEAYRGQSADFALNLNRRTLLTGEFVAVDDVVSQTAQALQQQFPKGFQSKIRDVVIGGTSGTQLTIQCQIQGRTAKVETVVILKHPYVWQIQAFGPADMSQYDENVEKFLSSIHFLTNDSKPAP